jgi:small subunit ribosomal protein S20
LPARKAARQSVKRRQRNLSVLRTTRTAMSGARRAVAAGDAEVAGTAVRQAISVLDKAVKKGVLHKNNASRRKARLAALLNRTQSTTTT